MRNYDFSKRIWLKFKIGLWKHQMYAIDMDYTLGQISMEECMKENAVYRNKIKEAEKELELLESAQ